MKNVSFLFFLLASSLCGGAVWAVQSDALLDRQVTMQVYPTEILESVVIRLRGHLDVEVDWDTRLLAPYTAKAADYRLATVRQVLDEQLEGTPMHYEVRKKKLVIYYSAPDDGGIQP